MTQEEKWQAVSTNDVSYDGKFYYAVKSTGIYCRPSCKSKQPNFTNVQFFETGTAAEEAGYRPCKRCRPDLMAYQPVEELAQKIKEMIDAHFLNKAHVFAELKQLGVTNKRAIEIFKEQFAMTPGEYADTLRMNEARLQLAESDQPMIDIAYNLGFESLSAFYALFGKYAEMTPGEFRKKAVQPSSAEPKQDIGFIYPTDFGPVTITVNQYGVTSVRFGEPAVSFPHERTRMTDLAAEQLEEYFSGKRTKFTVPLCPAGTPFQQSVWSALREIPYGSLRSYKEVAEHMGRPTASRAVGMANNKNPILIMIPCHRVVGADGSLVGYAAGLPVKQRLLDLEKEGLMQLK